MNQKLLSLILLILCIIVGTLILLLPNPDEVSDEKGVEEEVTNEFEMIESQFFSNFNGDDQVMELGSSFEIYSFPYEFDEAMKDRYRYGIDLSVIVENPDVVRVMGNQTIYATKDGVSRVTVQDEEGFLVTEFNVTVLPQTREGDLQVGDIGEGGGVVFYDKGVYSDGWRYLEVAPDYWNGKGYDQHIWWHNIPFEEFSQVDDDTFSDTCAAVGSGANNTRIIIDEMGQEGSYAALVCDRLVLQGKHDWFLPSSQELELLFSQDFGEVSLYGNEYWSSTTAGSPFDVDVMDTDTRTIQSLSILNEAYCRPVRAF